MSVGAVRARGARVQQRRSAEHHTGPYICAEVVIGRTHAHSACVKPQLVKDGASCMPPIVGYSFSSVQPSPTFAGSGTLYKSRCFSDCAGCAKDAGRRMLRVTGLALLQRDRLLLTPAASRSAH
jgi:hypothetical protein